MFVVVFEGGETYAQAPKTDLENRKVRTWIELPRTKRIKKILLTDGCIMFKQLAGYDHYVIIETSTHTAQQVVEVGGELVAKGGVTTSVKKQVVYGIKDVDQAVYHTKKVMATIRAKFNEQFVGVFGKDEQAIVALAKNQALTIFDLKVAKRLNRIAESAVGFISLGFDSGVMPANELKANGKDYIDGVSDFDVASYTKDMTRYLLTHSKKEFE